MLSGLRPRQIRVGLLLLLVVISFGGACVYAEGDFVLEGVYEIALDLPRIWYLLKRDPNGPPLEYQGAFVAEAFLDSGASGILLSYEMADLLGVLVDPNARFVDTGIGGDEMFNVSEPLYIGTANHEIEEPDDPNVVYRIFGPWRFQVKTYEVFPEEPIDIIGVPAMAGYTVVLDSGATNNWDYFHADIKDPCDPEIPSVEFEVALRFEKFINPSNPGNIPPLPVMAYNPVIDGIVVDHNSASSRGSWLFDTGASISLMSVEQGVSLGLTDEDGEPVVTPEYMLKIGGIGGEVNIPMFEIDELVVPTLNGYNLVYKDARLAVHDIKTIDEETGDFIILDGVFGSNFLCASAKMDAVSFPWPTDLSGTIFNKIVLDTRRSLLGFDVFDDYTTPYCGDPNHPRPAGDLTGDCKVNILDLYTFRQDWLRQDCDVGNDFCDGHDIGQDGKVNLDDYAILAKDWGKSAFISRCGDMDNPWPVGDINRDCSVDIVDLRIFAEEWLNKCDWLNWNCRGCDFSSDGNVNFADFSTLF